MPPTARAVTAEYDDLGDTFDVVIDDGLPLRPGRIHRTPFLVSMSAAIEQIVNEELERAGRSARDCPYLVHWLNYYRGQPAEHINRAVRHYARPERHDLQGLQTAVVSRVRRAVAVWIESNGRVVDAPPGVAWLGHDDRVPTEGNATPLRRKSRQGAEDAAVSARSPAAVRARLGQGRPLDGGVRNRMERVFGQTLADVHVHTDAPAASVADSLSARAFSVGKDIAFAGGQYRPGTLRGDVLLAHEVAHALSFGETGGERSAELAANRAAVAVGSRLLLGQSFERLTSVPAAGSGELQLRRCGTVSEPEPTVLGDAEMRALGYHIDPPSGEPTVGRSYQLTLRGPLATRQSGTSDLYSGHWFIQKPGDPEPHGIAAWTGSSGSWTLDTEGEWLFGVEVSLGSNRFGILTHSVNVRQPGAVAQARLNQIPPTNLASFLSRLELQNLTNIRLGVAQQNFGPAYISLTGSNPAAAHSNYPNIPSNRYTVHPPPGVTPARYQWSAVPDDLSHYPAKALFGFPRRQINGRDGFDLGTGTTASWYLGDQTGIIEIYCTMYDAHGAVFAEARYHQVILTAAERQHAEAFQTYMREARAELRKLQEREILFVPAVHVATDTGVPTELSMFVGRPVQGSGLKIIDGA